MRKIAAAAAAVGITAVTVVGLAGGASATGPDRLPQQLDQNAGHLLHQPLEPVDPVSGHSIGAVGMEDG